MLYDYLFYFLFHHVIACGMSFEDVQNFLIEFKEKVKKQRKELSKKYHPDKTGGDDAKIKEINNVVDLVMKLEIKKQIQRPVNVRIYTTFTSNSTNTGSSSWTSHTYYRSY
jgi:hypothetical protein